jgi:regulatory protein
LRTGHDVSAERLKELRDAESRHQAMAGALRLLAYRPRSERELRDALRRRGKPEEVIGETLRRMRELGLIDDAAFARSYVEIRSHSSPRSARLLSAELASRGVNRADRERSLAGADDADSAYRAAARRARALASADRATFQRRIGDHLLRRGFGYEVARNTVARLWDERAAS